MDDAICGWVEGMLEFLEEDGSVNSVKGFGKVKSETVEWGVGFITECLMESKGPEDISATDAVSSSALS